MLESTTLNLEIYFEHRNYLPAAFLFLPVFIFIGDKMRSSMFVIVAAALLLVLGGFTRYTATIWSAYPAMVQASAKKAPTSVRAHAEFAKLLFNDGRYEESLAVVDQAIARQASVRPHLELIRLSMLCNLSVLDDDELGRVAQRTMTTTYDERLLSIFDEFVQSVLGGKCPNTSLGTLHSMFDKLLENPVNADTRSVRFSQIQYFMGLVDSRNGLPDRASREFRASLEANPSASAALNIAAILATGGYHSQGLEFVATARTLYEQGRTASGVAELASEGDIDRLESMIRRSMSPQDNDD
jgi:tetratricopeptide (TPR) repeat protein